MFLQLGGRAAHFVVTAPVACCAAHVREAPGRTEFALPCSVLATAASTACLDALFPLPSSLSSAGCTFIWRFMSASLSFPMCRMSGVIPEPPAPWAGRKWTVVTCGRRLPGAAASQQCLLLVLGVIFLRKLVASVRVSSRPALAFGAGAVGHRVSHLLCSLSVSLSSPI